MSPRHKKEVSWRHLYEKIRVVATVLIVFSVFTAGVFLFAQITLEQIFSDAISRAELVADINEDNEFRAAVNSRIENILKIQDNYIPWSYFIEYAAEGANQNLKFNSLEIDKEKEQMKLMGVAGNRDSLLRFKNELQNSSYVSEVIFPIENILKRENINFNIKVKYNLEDLKNNNYEF